MRLWLFILLFILNFSSAWADQAEPLSANKAFHLTAKVETSKQLNLNWQLAKGYYLYKDAIKVSTTPESAAHIEMIRLSPGHPKQDEIRGNYEVYFDTLQVPLVIKDGNSGILKLSIRYQGCSSDGFCYPPQQKYLTLNLADIKPGQDISSAISRTAAGSMDDVNDSTIFSQHKHIVWILLSFLGLGLLLAFTPCVLPMVPILSSIIVGYGRDIGTRKAFSLSLAYVLGMALTYALAGIVVALIGSNIQVALQKPEVIIVFSGLFVLLALSLFGLFDLKLPNQLHQRMVSWSHRHTGGTYVGVFCMGALSTLIVSPCVSAPLVGVLAYIGKSGDIVLGGLALLALGLGMGLPLLLLGASAGKLLPKAGEWMDAVKQFFGLLMLGLAIWMLARVLPGSVILFLWSVLALITAIFVWRVQHSKKLWRQVHQGLGLIILSYSFILMGGSFLGRTDPFYILAHNTMVNVASMTPQFTIVNNMTELDRQLLLAKQNKQRVLLDFYADWCVSCVLMDKNVFSQPEVQQALAKFLLLRADVTKNNAFDQAIQKRFKVIAPPTILFFDTNGEELKRNDIVGEVNVKEFLANIDRVRYDRGLKHCQSGVSTC